MTISEDFLEIKWSDNIRKALDNSDGEANMQSLYFLFESILSYINRYIDGEQISSNVYDVCPSFVTISHSILQRKLE